MKNWKKWAAGICALSLCMTAVSLPAAAEGEDDIALISDTSEDMPVADGTDGGDASSELCNERFQPQNRFHQRAFAGAVFSYDAEIVACKELKGEVLENGLPIVADTEPLTSELSHRPTSLP